jgi:hypothetical protein
MLKQSRLYISKSIDGIGKMVITKNLNLHKVKLILPVDKMNMEKYCYKILVDRRLIIKYYQGPFSKFDLITCMEETGQDILYDPTFSVINDFRDAELSLKTKEIDEFVLYVKGHKILYGKRNITFLTSTPNQTVFPIMLHHFKKETFININIFSTLLASIQWLGFTPSDLDAINGYINELKNQFYSPFTGLT